MTISRIYGQIHVKKGTDVIIGATIVGEGAGDMISEVTVAMQSGVGLAKLVSTLAIWICLRVFVMRNNLFNYYLIFYSIF